MVKRYQIWMLVNGLYTLQALGRLGSWMFWVLSRMYMNVAQDLVCQDGTASDTLKSQTFSKGTQVLPNTFEPVPYSIGTRMQPALKF